MARPCDHPHGTPQPDGCNVCRLYVTRDDFRALWDASPPVAQPPAAPRACRFEGEPLTGRERESAGLDHAKRWLHCLNPDKPLGPIVCPCKGCRVGCRGYTTHPPPVATVHRVGTPAVLGGVREFFNGSTVRHEGRLLLAYRIGWAGSNIYTVTLDEDYQPSGTPRMVGNLAHAMASHGREDPRLFYHQGRLHLSYTGVARDRRGSIVTHQMYARLTSALDAEKPIHPHYEHRGPWEKNWQFFSREGELYCIYSIAPHVILHVIGDRAHPFARSPTLSPWSGGELRGGAPPAMHGGKWYHWFHGRIGEWSRGIYTVGCYTFDDRPPFSVTSLSPDPIVKGDMSTRPADQSKEPAVIFPGGAFIDGDNWVVTSGIHDRWVEIHKFNRKSVDDYLT